MTIAMYLFAGAFLTIAIPGTIALIKDSIESDRELREKGLL